MPRTYTFKIKAEMAGDDNIYWTDYLSFIVSCHPNTILIPNSLTILDNPTLDNLD